MDENLLVLVSSTLFMCFALGCLIVSEDSQTSMKWWEFLLASSFVGFIVAPFGFFILFVVFGAFFWIPALFYVLISLVSSLFGVI